MNNLDNLYSYLNIGFEFDTLTMLRQRYERECKIIAYRCKDINLIGAYVTNIWKLSQLILKSR